VKLNPTVGFYDPLSLADAELFGSSEAAIGYLRHAELEVQQCAASSLLLF